MLENLSGATRLYPIIGHPIAQVKAPNGLTRILAAKQRNAVVIPIDIEPENLMAFMTGAALVRNIDGFAVTIPHKFAAAKLCATLSTTSRLLGAANIMRRNPDGTWHGDMLDGMGHVGAMIRNGCVTQGKRALLVGAGGAGSAIALALLDAGVAQLAIHDGDAKRRDALVATLNEAHPGKVEAGSADPSGFDVISNATPAGMRPGDPFPVDPTRLRKHMFVGEVITQPEVTPLLEEARKLGCGTSTGVEMFHSQSEQMVGFWLAAAPQA